MHCGLLAAMASRAPRGKDWDGEGKRTVANSGKKSAKYANQTHVMMCSFIVDRSVSAGHQVSDSSGTFASPLGDRGARM
jgi:hypothetical protein